jgi:chromosome segregation ATPase
MANEDAKERIRTLFPGDENKGLRHALFSLPDFLKSDPSDEEILEQARLISGDSKPDPTPEVAEENPTSRIKEVLAPEAEAKLVHKQAAELTSGDLPTVIETAEEYQKASLLFASGKKMLKDNEAKRKKLKAPILEAGQRIDDEFKAAADTIHALIDPIEFRMNTFKQ